MDAQEILKSLSNLEQSLQGVESARQLVEKTVAAYEGASIQIATLAEEFAGISRELNTVVSTIRTNQQVLEHSLSEKAEAVFTRINNRVTVIGSELDTIHKTFESECSAAATSVKDNVSDTLQLFNKKVQAELDNMAKTLSDFKAIIAVAESDFKTHTNHSVLLAERMLTSAADNFQDKLTLQLKAFSDLKGELEGIVNHQKKLTSELFVKMEAETKSIKESISELDRQIHDLNHISESNHKELIDILSALIQGNNPSAEKMSARFNSVDGNIGAVKEGVSSVSSQLGTATTQIIDENKQTLLAEVTAVKAENANIKNMVIVCLVAISVTLLLTIIMFIR